MWSTATLTSLRASVSMIWVDRPTHTANQIIEKEKHFLILNLHEETTATPWTSKNRLMLDITINAEPSSLDKLITMTRQYLVWICETTALSSAPSPELNFDVWVIMWGVRAYRAFPSHGGHVCVPKQWNLSPLGNECPFLMQRFSVVLEQQYGRRENALYQDRP